MKLVEVPLTPLDKMFTGGPVSYTPGSAKKLTPGDTPPAPPPEPVEPSAPPPEPDDQTT
jgi:hypothetical protein